VAALGVSDNSRQVVRATKQMEELVKNTRKVSESPPSTAMLVCSSPTAESRLGHESLDVTLDYLKGRDTVSEEPQEHANSSNRAALRITGKDIAAGDSWLTWHARKHSGNRCLS